MKKKFLVLAMLGGLLAAGLVLFGCNSDGGAAPTAADLVGSWYFEKEAAKAGVGTAYVEFDSESSKTAKFNLPPAADAEETDTTDLTYDDETAAKITFKRGTGTVGTVTYEISGDLQELVIANSKFTLLPNGTYYKGSK